MMKVSVSKTSVSSRVPCVKFQNMLYDLVEHFTGHLLSPLEGKYLKEHCDTWCMVEVQS